MATVFPDADDPNFEIIISEHGQGRRLLRDGGVARVSLRMRDSLPSTNNERLRVSDGSGDSLSLHRPGPRVFADSAATRAARQSLLDAYRDAELAQTNAWRNPDPDGLLGIAEEGDVCTVREGGVDEGSPGHLRRIGDRLVCVPDQRSQDARSLHDAKIQAYQDYETDLANAWRRR